MVLLSVFCVFALPTCPFAALNTTAEASGSPRTTICCGGRGAWTPGTPPLPPEHPHDDLGTSNSPVFAGTIAPPLSQDPEVHPSRAPLLPVDSPGTPKARLRLQRWRLWPLLLVALILPEAQWEAALSLGSPGQLPRLCWTQHCSVTFLWFRTHTPGVLAAKADLKNSLLRSSQSSGSCILDLASGLSLFLTQTYLPSVHPSRKLESQDLKESVKRRREAE